jgi:chromosome segregation ATPase
VNTVAKIEKRQEKLDNVEKRLEKLETSVSKIREKVIFNTTSEELKSLNVSVNKMRRDQFTRFMGVDTKLDAVDIKLTDLDTKLTDLQENVKDLKVVQNKCSHY